MKPVAKIRELLTFSRKCLRMMAEDKLMFSSFLALSVLGALTEGATVSLLVPILQAQSNAEGYSNIPVLHHVSALFDGMTPSQRIQSVAMVMAVVFVMRGLIQYGADVLGQIVPQRLMRSAMARNYSAIMQVHISYVNETDLGTLLNNVSSWAARVSQLLTNVSSLLWASLIFTAYGLLMVTVSWKLSLLAMAFVLAMSAFLKKFSHGPLRQAGQRYSASSAEMSQTLMESLGGMKLIRLSAAETLMEETFLRRLDQAINCQRRMTLINGVSSPFLATGAGLFICLLLFGSAVAHENDPNAWVSSILIFLFLLFRLLGPVTQMSNARNRIISDMHAFEGQEEFRHTAEVRRQPNGSRPAPHMTQGVSLENLVFSYKPEDGPVLKGVSALIEKGKMTAVVGPSGAGKSTLIALITRLYDPQEGRVLVDGVDLKDLEVRSWRRRLAVVAQDTFIFNDTVANNLRFGRGDVSPERLREAARLAAADSFIEKLPDGYDTLLGDRGVRLSGGQQQRIAIARAILADPELLVLDEATSSLDTFTERAIQEAVDHLAKDRTLLVIAHRLSTIRRADKVIVLKDGVVAETGRHEELLKKRGIYWEMVEHQRLDLAEEDSAEAKAEAGA